MALSIFFPLALKERLERRKYTITRIVFLITFLHAGTGAHAPASH